MPHAVTITNTGTGDLALPNDAFAITGPGATRFSLTNVGTLPRKLAPGQSATFNVLFTASAKGIVGATLTIKSNDAANPTRTLSLRGLGTTGEGGSDEPSLQRIFDLYELPIQTGDPDAETTDYPAQKNVANSDEVLLQTLRMGRQRPGDGRASGEHGDGQRQQLYEHLRAVLLRDRHHDRDAAFHDPQVAGADRQPVSRVGQLQLRPDDRLRTRRHLLRLRPPATSGARTAKNTWEPNADEQRKVRFFPLKDKSGNVVPNAYVFAFEEYELATDQNDIVGIIRNVRPAAASPELTVENKDGVPFPDRLVFNRIPRRRPPSSATASTTRPPPSCGTPASVPLTLTSASIKQRRLHHS